MTLIHRFLQKGAHPARARVQAARPLLAARVAVTTLGLITRIGKCLHVLVFSVSLFFLSVYRVISDCK